MSDERPDELDRLESAADAIESLQSLFAFEEPLDETLRQIAVAAAGAIVDADQVSITVLDTPSPRTVAYTDERVVTLDAAQYESNRGPCLQAAGTQLPVRAVMDEEQDRWPEFVTLARDYGIKATLSVPLLIDGADNEAEMVGSLNVYSATASAFDPFDETLMRIFTLTAGQAITAARRSRQSRETIDQLFEALQSRSVIDQAKGALRAIHSCSEEEAFQRLTKESQNTNVKLRVVAKELLEGL
jgi:GAF domain-containing protein